METTNQSIPVEGNQDQTQTNPVENGSGNEQDSSEDLVKYSTYKKVLSEKKALQSKHAETVAKLAEHEAREKQKEENQLIADKEFDKVLNERNNEIEDLRLKLNESNKTLDDTIKLQHFISALGSSKIESKYFNFIPLDKIQVHEDGSINKENLVNVVEEFKAEHPRLLVRQKNNLPNHHVNSEGKSGTITYKAWRELKSSREQAEKYKDIDWSTR